MTEEQILKKKRGRKPTSERGGHAQSSSTSKTLASIVWSSGSRVDIPKLPFNFSELTTYDHLRIAMEHAALATCSLNQLKCRSIPTLTMSHSLDPIRLNLEDAMNHLCFAIELFDQSRGAP